MVLEYPKAILPETEGEKMAGAGNPGPVRAGPLIGEGKITRKGEYIQRGRASDHLAKKRIGVRFHRYERI